MVSPSVAMFKSTVYYLFISCLI